MTEKEQQKLDIEEASNLFKSIRLSPSKKRIYSLSKEHLLQYNALILHKGCTSLSSAERRMVQERVGYGLRSEQIKPEEVADSVNELSKLIKKEILEKTKEDGSSSNQ